MSGVGSLLRVEEGGGQQRWISFDSAVWEKRRFPEGTASHDVFGEEGTGPSPKVDFLGKKGPSVPLNLPKGKGKKKGERFTKVKYRPPEEGTKKIRRRRVPRNRPSASKKKKSRLLLASLISFTRGERKNRNGEYKKEKNPEGRNPSCAKGSPNGQGLPFFMGRFSAEKGELHKYSALKFVLILV